MAPENDNAEVFVDAQWFDRHRKDSAILIIDTRPPKEYWAGHVEGARHFDPYPFAYYDTSEHGLQVFRRQHEWIFSTLGVSGNETVLFYETDTGMRATRAAWVLEYLGHGSVRILDGGLKALPNEKLTTAAPTITPAPFRERERPEMVASLAMIKERLHQRGTQLFDVRTPEEYFGENIRSRHGGAIPGAVNLNWTEVNAPSGALKTPDELRAQYHALGLDPANEIITYCQGGYRAAHAYYALRRAGFKRVRNYVGSWGEWGNHDDVPIDHPSRPA
jgi:thiosulfate/3-mercaptopyruvate sulfurtransferase